MTLDYFVLFTLPGGRHAEVHETSYLHRVIRIKKIKKKERERISININQFKKEENTREIVSPLLNLSLYSSINLKRRQ